MSLWYCSAGLDKAHLTYVEVENSLSVISRIVLAHLPVVIKVVCNVRDIGRLLLAFAKRDYCDSPILTVPKVSLWCHYHVPGGLLLTTMPVSAFDEFAHIMVLKLPTVQPP